MSENGRQWGQRRPLERGHPSRGTAMSARAPWERPQECSTVLGSRSLGRSSSLPPRAVPLVDLTVAWPEAAALHYRWASQVLCWDYSQGFRTPPTSWIPPTQRQQ